MCPGQTGVLILTSLGRTLSIGNFIGHEGNISKDIHELSNLIEYPEACWMLLVGLVSGSYYYIVPWLSSMRSVLLVGCLSVASAIVEVWLLEDEVVQRSVHIHVRSYLYGVVRLLRTQYTSVRKSNWDEPFIRD